MRFMNEGEVEMWAERYADHPVIGPATRTLASLMEAANDNSDGWAFWPKPARSAAKLMELLQGDGTWAAANAVETRVTPAAVRAALGPIKSFRTRSGIQFEIYEPPKEGA